MIDGNLSIINAHLDGTIEQLDRETPINEQDSATIQREIDAIKHDQISFSELNTLSQKHRSTDFPAKSVLVNLHIEEADRCDFVTEALEKLLAKTEEVSFDHEEIDLIEPDEEPRRADVIRDQLERNKQLVFHGPPGTGKTYTARNFARWWLTEEIDSPTTDHLRFVTFHPSFNYEDFFEGLTAKQSDSGSVSYEIEDGIFKRICHDAERAYNDADDPSEAPPYVLVIDEINRGNLAKIFGETITLLESDKRLKAKNEITVDLAHSGREFGVPPNLYLIGTMNTADRSIALVDAALRRRFSFLSFPPNYEVLKREYEITSGRSDYTGSPSFGDLLKRSIGAIQVINKNILESGELGKGKQVGHSYLLGLETTADVVSAWQFDILPLLEEYYFGELGRLQESIFETESCGLFDDETSEIADLNSELLASELEVFLDQTTQDFSIQQ